MKWRGFSVNLVSLGAIDPGMIVDGAEVLIENCVQRLSPANPDEKREYVFEIAATAVARPVLFSVLIVIAVYLPILTHRGIEGKMFTPMATTAGFALLDSLFLALMVMPAAARLILPKRNEHREVLSRAARTNTTRRHGRKRYTAKGECSSPRSLSCLVQLRSCLCSESSFIPELEVGAHLSQPIRMPGIRLSESIEINKQVQMIIMQFLEVEFAVGRLRRPDIATDPMGVSLSALTSHASRRVNGQW